MNEIVYERKVCRLCNSPRLKLALPLKATALADEFLPESMLSKEQPTYPLDLYLCEDCGFTQLVHIVIPKAIYLDYTYETVSSLGLVEHFKKYAKEVTDALKIPTGSLVVDVGSNDGSLLRGFKALGYKVLGVDPAREIARKATESGIETIADFFVPDLANKLKVSHGKASLMTANNIYANVDDLEQITVAIREMMADDGVFVYESFYALDWMKNMVFDFMYHEHLSYFSIKPMAQFFDRLGMQLFDAWPVSTKGGSLRCFVQKKSGTRPVTPAIKNYTENEVKEGLFELKTFQAYEQEILKKKKAVLDFIVAEKAKGKIIAAYGASATTTTMMYHFDLGDKLAYIFDDYKVKQNTFSPGHKIPVYAPDEIYTRKPDYIYIFAWRYVAPIVAKHQKFLDQGGKFIVPLPELRIIGK